ncbi:hypothetical protein ES703_39335 [subsurface metagenome]
MSPVADLLYEIDETDPNITIGDDIAAGLAVGIWHTLATYLNPAGIDLIFLPESDFQAYLYDLEAAPAEMGDYVRVRITHKDAAAQGTLRRLLTQYLNTKYNADKDSRKKFQSKFRLKPREQLVLEVLVPTGSSIDVSACHFQMTCRQVAALLTA